jgi:hypothetical protein
VSEMRERVARAFWETWRKRRINSVASHLSWDEITDPETHNVNPNGLEKLADDIRGVADACLAAMREPTEPMFSAPNGLDCRITNIARNERLTVDALGALSDQELLRIPNLGKAVLARLRELYPKPSKAIPLEALK